MNNIAEMYLTLQIGSATPSPAPQSTTPQPIQTSTQAYGMYIRYCLCIFVPDAVLSLNLSVFSIAWNNIFGFKSILYVQCIWLVAWLSHVLILIIFGRIAPANTSRLAMSVCLSAFLSFNILVKVSGWSKISVKKMDANLKLYLKVTNNKF